MWAHKFNSKFKSLAEYGKLVAESDPVNKLTAEEQGWTLTSNTIYLVSSQVEVGMDGEKPEYIAQELLKFYSNSALSPNSRTDPAQVTPTRAASLPLRFGLALAVPPQPVMHVYVRI